MSTGEAPGADPPIRWSEEENVAWKLPLPGLGHSTPVAWGDLLFLTAARPVGETLPVRRAEPEGAHDNFAADRLQEFLVLAVSRSRGEILWQQAVVKEQPHEGAHETGSWASNSPVTDGKRVYAFFGSRGLYALDFSGKPVWSRDFGDMEVRHGHGEGSSPALHGNTLVISWDHQGQSFVVAVDSRTGKTLWRVEREEITSWASPLIVEHGGKAQVILSATGKVRGYDLATGALIWECGGLSRNVVASPVAADGWVYVGNSYDARAMLAIRLDKAKGDITGTDAVAWAIDRHTPYVPSPLLWQGRICFLKHSQAFFSCLGAKSGEPIYGPLRLPRLGMIFASPVAAAGRIYITGREGATVVLSGGEAPEVLALNSLEDAFSASAVAIGEDLYLRGEEFLYCLRQDANPGGKKKPAEN